MISCKRGHLQSKPNVIVYTWKDKTYFQCKICRRMRDRRRYAARTRDKQNCRNGHPFRFLDASGKRRCGQCDNGKGNCIPFARKEKCINGHPYVEGSFFINGRGYRVCRECYNASNRRYRAREVARATQAKEWLRYDP